MSRRDDPCDICRGTRSIRLPVFQRASMSYGAQAEPQPMNPGHREYPCPECAQTVSEDQIVTAHAVDEIRYHPSMSTDPGFRQSVISSLALRIALEAVDRGWLMLNWREPDPTDPLGRLKVKGSLSFVSPVAVANLEQRVAERQREVATDVIVEATRQINNWGSHHGATGITKDQASSLMSDALKKVLADRKAMAMAEEIV